MNVSERLFRPSARIQGRVQTKQARFLSQLLAGRAFALFIVAAFVQLSDVQGMHPAAQALGGAMALNVVAYLISRTVRYRWAAYMVIAESLISVPILIYRTQIPDIVMAAPYWMALVPMMSAAVLDVRATLVVAILGAVSFAVMSSFVLPHQLPGIGAAMVFYSIAALLAGAASMLTRE